MRFRGGIGMKINTYTVPPSQKAKVLQRCDSIDVYVPQGQTGAQGEQGQQGEPGSGGVPLNYFDGWTANLSTTLNGTVILPTSITRETDNGISYNDKTGIVKISTGWWFVQYGFTVASSTAQTVTTYITQDGVIIPPSKLDQPLLANQPQTISRTFVVSASTNFNLAFVTQTAGVQLSQVNWFVKMLED